MLATKFHTANHICYVCGATFHTLQAYYVRMGRGHKPEHHPTNWATGTRCLTCSREYHDYARQAKHLKPCPAFAESWRSSVPLLDDATAKKNRDAILQIQRADIKDGLPANHASVPSYKTDVPPTYHKGSHAAHEPPIPAPARKLGLWGPGRRLPIGSRLT